MLNATLAWLHLSETVTLDHVMGVCVWVDGLVVGGWESRLSRRVTSTLSYRPHPQNPLQAYRLVKNSIINVEQPDQELADDDVLDDVQEVEHMVSVCRVGGRADRWA